MRRSILLLCGMLVTGQVAAQQPQPDTLFGVNKYLDFEQVAEWLRQPAYQWYAKLWRAMRAATRGRFDEQRVHEGYDWLYVLSGRLRLLLGDREVILGPGEAAEFDTRVPHWFGSADSKSVEFLSLFGKQGERAHLRAKPSSS